MIRCLVMDVLLLRAFASAGVCLPSRCVHITVLNFGFIINSTIFTFCLQSPELNGIFNFVKLIFFIFFF
jgi:hypothetical protein